VRHVAVSVLVLVSTGVVAEVGCRSVAGDGAFGDTGHCWGVVRSVCDGSIGGVMIMPDD
jgi:hypothetical protein